MKFTNTMILAASLAINSVEAFWGTGHILVAFRAQQILEQENPAVLQSALNQLLVLKQSHASLITREVNHPFVECSTFADDIKSTYSFQAGWHFIDQPYLDKGGDISDFSFKEDTYELRDALIQLTAMVEGKPDTSSYYYQQISKNFTNTEDAKSFALRMIIHYAGDIHQPLHAVAEVDSTYPSGDKGGNYESIPSTGCGASNLHAVWDSVAYSYCGFPTMPISSTDWTYYTSENAAMVTKYPVDMSKVAAGDFQAWLDEQYNIAVKYVYPGMTAGESLSAEYIATANTIERENIMMGGRRLADLMVSIYGGNGLFLQ